MKKTVKEIKEIFQLIRESSDLEKQKELVEFYKDDSRESVKKIVQGFLKYKEKEKEEIARIREMYNYEREMNSKGYEFIAGTDEAGRGPLAGPVVAASVILSPETIMMGLNDSKKLSAKKREELAEVIKKEALAFSVVEISPEVIDEINILNAAHLGMKKSLENLSIKADFVLVDGTKNKQILRPQLPLVKGDSKSASIAAASILAKVYRDKLMEEYSVLYPEYGFEKHKGYPTKDHIEAVEKHGVLSIHRKTFAPISNLK